MSRNRWWIWSCLGLFLCSQLPEDAPTIWHHRNRLSVGIGKTIIRFKLPAKLKAGLDDQFRSALHCALDDSRTYRKGNEVSTTSTTTTKLHNPRQEQSTEDAVQSAPNEEGAIVNVPLW